MGRFQITSALHPLLFGLLLGACTPTTEPAARPIPESSPEMFLDITDHVNLKFKHDNGGGGRKYLPEIMGSGGCALDYDGDQVTDLYFVQSGRMPGSEFLGEPVGNQLFRNRGDGTFEDVTAASGSGDLGYGMGATAADYDNDGDPDIYVINFGADRLLRNNGDGTFTDVTEQAGIESPLWGSSAAFFDADGDGWLDLYVVNYLDFTVETHVDCGRPSKGIFSYCTPDAYPMAPDVFFRNRGDGTFEEYTVQAGLVDEGGKGLGIVASDFNNDSWIDLYIANDSTPNFLYQNRGDGTFEEVGLMLGVGYNEDGLTEAGMGTDTGDLNGDGYFDIFVTNLSNETNALYLGGQLEFKYHTRSSGIHQASYMPVGFGTDIFDVDNDTDFDILVTNGHIIDNIELLDDSQSFRQPTQLFLNNGDASFSLLDSERSGDISEPRVGRGTINLDYDLDGCRDFVITFNNAPARLFRNQCAGAGNWIGFRLQQSGKNRDAIGARVEVEVGGKTIVDEIRAGSGYQTSSEAVVHYGLGVASSVERVRVRWPGGETQEFPSFPANSYYVLTDSGQAERLTPLSSLRASRVAESGIQR